MIAIVAAVSQNGVIGLRNEIPWHIPSDLKRFKKLTTGGVVLVGRKTHEGIFARLGHTLPHRTTLVISRKPEHEVGCRTLPSFTSALSESFGRPTWIIGGAELYREALIHPAVTHLHLTRVLIDIEGDVFFPSYDQGNWELIPESTETLPAGNGDEFATSFAIYRRRSHE